MDPKDQRNQQPAPALPVLPTIRTKLSSPRVPLILTPTAGAQRKIAIAVDLSDESAFAVRWAVDNYLRPGDEVVLLHVRATSILYGADWGFINKSSFTSTSSKSNGNGNNNNRSHRLQESGENELTDSNAKNIAEPLEEARIPYKIHIVKDHDLKERLCLEVERLGLCAMIMGSRGIGAVRKSNIGRLGSVSDYCVNHCVCPVVVVRDPEVSKNDVVGEEVELHPVPEEEMEYHDASDDPKDA
ncbi:hypothetical protein Dsin_031561 [Dipteronia sinensis]|uniref:UspA domain-containing protein n=1 Tax=Dipteronia sinensis TaxID=43782 RepID=A0AAD9ZMP3_9ROSI|nr:hypothetical protein Dsin_031561 [Dipteronia sinensis]